MKAITRSAKIIRNQSGMIVADFIFAFSLVAGMSVLFFSISYSLAVVEVTQYVSYSVARAYSAGNKDHGEQEIKAKAKFTQLTSGKSAIAALYSGTWFKIGGEDKLDLRGGESGNGKNFSDDLAGGEDKRGVFLGASFPLQLGLFKLKIPFIGDTAPDHDEGLTTRINSMVIRDPSTSECKAFLNQRAERLQALPSGSLYYDRAAYVPLEDNGC